MKDHKNHEKYYMKYIKAWKFPSMKCIFVISMKYNS